MEISDPYDVIIKKMREYPNDIPVDETGNVSEAFKEYLKLFFTPEEAKVAQHLEIMPLSVNEIAKRMGKSRKETKQILKNMADKGIIQDIAGYSYFVTVAHLFNIGFKYTKALERLGKKGAELYQQFFITEKFYKRYESSDEGTPLTRIVPIEKAIDHQSVITNAEEIHQILDNCIPPIVATDCPCRNRTETLGIRECKGKYPIEESCLQVGPFGRYFLDRGEGKELTIEEAHVLVDKLAKLGLLFTTENVIQANHQIICCCCECCCSLLRGMTRFEEKNEFCTAKSNYISQVNEDLCIGCGLCVERCIFGAITLANEKASVNTEKCYGCGACAVTCPSGAIKLHRRERSEILKNFKELTERIYKENRM
ncbi:MAG: 4Fe-4S dicluster domain-containing protein [Promethearchaeota archaeon]|nr:MAG: 4Fe-4S dicluster domain-containing protein [Candidatus Lokiarchaeota archaeon]